MRKLLAAAGLLAAVAMNGGCSIRRLAINSLADSLSRSGDLFAAEDDPELVRDAAPFALKTIEGLLAEVPEHEGLLLSACQGFTQYAFAFVETDAVLARPDDHARATRNEERALRLYLRARDYCMRGLELSHEGIGRRLMLDPAGAVRDVPAGELEWLFWTGASWGSAISIGSDRPELVADLPAVMALMRRALEIDETYQDGAIHAAFISLESLPEAMGGSEARAREHFQRAVELSDGKSAGPYVVLAANVSVSNQDRAEFERLLGKALAIDPDATPGTRLENLIVQRRARHLLDHEDDLILPVETDVPGDVPEENAP